MGGDWYISSRAKVLGASKTARYVEIDGSRHWVPPKVMRSDSVCRVGDSAELVVNGKWWRRHQRRDGRRTAVR